MPFSLFKKNKSPDRPAVRGQNSFQYSPVSPHDIRLLRYAPDSTPKAIRLEVQSFDRRTKPKYIALSYVWGRNTYQQSIKLNGKDKRVWPNLYNALCSMREALPEWFWIDALCIDQANVQERNEQVRQMSFTYANASHVASWLGPCSEQLRLAFEVDLRTTRAVDLPKPSRERLKSSICALGELPYWGRIWVQQELFLNRNIVLYCGDYSLPMQMLVNWANARGNSSEGLDTYFYLSLALDWATWRKAPILRLLDWAGKHKSTDPRDKVFALLSLTCDHERKALERFFPDYDLTLRQVLMVTLVHIRHFAGQERAARQVDSVLICLGEPGDTQCSNTVRDYLYRLGHTNPGSDGRRVIRTSSSDRRALQSRTLLGGQVSELDVCDCIFAQELAYATGEAVDVRSERTWQPSGMFVQDAKLSRELNHFWNTSMSEESAQRW